MIGKFLLMCVFGVGWLGIIAGFRELRKRYLARREDDALFRARAAELAKQQRAHERALRAMPRSELSQVLMRLEESAGFAVPEEALAPVSGPIEVAPAPRPAAKLAVTVRAVASTVRRIAAQIATTVRPRAIATWRRARVAVGASMTTTRRAASRVTTTTRTRAVPGLRRIAAPLVALARRVPVAFVAAGRWLAAIGRRLAASVRRGASVTARRSRTVAVVAARGVSTRSQRAVAAVWRFANPPPDASTLTRTASGTGAQPVLGARLPAIASASSTAPELELLSTTPPRTPPPPLRRR